MKNRLLTSREPFVPVDFSKIRVGAQTLEDAIYNVGELKRANPKNTDVGEILRAIQNLDYDRMRDISNFFYRSSGIYSRMLRYFAYMYRYDWYVTPYIDSAKSERALDGFDKALHYLESFNVKKTLGEIALKVMRNGCYYGYKILLSDRVQIQELPPKYCRTRINVGDSPAVEFNMRYFDDTFPLSETREKILNMFPEEFRKGYRLYKAGKLPVDFLGSKNGWYMLDPAYTVKFNVNGEDIPPLLSVIPAIIALDEAQALDKKKMQQRLLKVIIQKMPLNKDCELVFDPDEAQALHNNAVNMLKKAIGVDVLTTFADVDVADMDTNAAATATDDLERVERTVYNEAGISQLQFNSDNSVALEKSILNDEASVYNLVQQFEIFLNQLLEPFNKSPKKVYYKVQILGTTIYNYKDLAKMYKDQTQMGYSKMLPQIALGQSQSSILANAYFENDVLDLVNVFIPPLTSNTMNADSISTMKGTSSSKSSGDSDSGAGRPTNEEAGKPTSEKTIQNKESQGAG